MSVKLLTEHRLEFVSLKGGYTGSHESTLVKMHCVAAQFMIRADAYNTLGTFISQRKGKKSGKYHKSSFSCMQCAVSCSSSLNFFFFNFIGDTAIMFLFFFVKSAFVRPATACYPSLKTTTTTRGLTFGFFDLKHVREPLPRPFVCCWYY